jgi:antitoxin component YwqK of YwqJK toxin-antitoxin module
MRYLLLFLLPFWLCAYTTVAMKAKNKTYIDYNLSEGEGIVKIYYPTGELKYIIPYKHNRAEGEAKKFYKNSRLRALIPMKKAQIDGRVRIYYSDGKTVKYTLEYKQNQLDGRKQKYNRNQQIIHTLIYRNGTIDLSSSNHFKEAPCGSVSYYENKQLEYNISCKKSYKIIKGYYCSGEIEYEIGCRQNQKNGLSYIYYGSRQFDELKNIQLLSTDRPPNSVHKELSFRRGKLNGLSKIYDKKANLIEEIRYKENLREGVSIQYRLKNGEKIPIRIQTEYKNNQKNGKERYFVKGELERESMYRNGQKDGRELIKVKEYELVQYYKKGKLHGIQSIYQNAKLIESNEYREGEIVHKRKEMSK